MAMHCPYLLLWGQSIASYGGNAKGAHSFPKGNQLISMRSHYPLLVKIQKILDFIRGKAYCSETYSLGSLSWFFFFNFFF